MRIERPGAVTSVPDFSRRADENRALRSLPRVFRQGGALLAVLWLSAALSAIAFSLANTVRGEIERASTATDGLRSYYLASGAIERAILWILWSGHANPDGSPRYYRQGMAQVRFPFPTGEAVVEIIPESAKLNVNQASAQELMRLFLSLGVDSARAQELTAAVVDWRTYSGPDRLTQFDQHYLSRTPSFRARHASLEEIEELLLVRGMTPDLFYGTWQRTQEGRLVPMGGLKDCVTVFGAPGSALDVNSAHPALLRSIGLSPAAVAAIVERRSRMPFRTMEELQALGPLAGEVQGRLRVGGGSIVSLRATATLRLANGQFSDIRRSVMATVKFNQDGASLRPYEILRWYDNAATR